MPTARVRLVTPHTALDVNIPFESPANQHVISADGTHATFFSQETLVPTGSGGGFGDTYSVSLATGAYTLLTPGVTGETVDGIVNRAGTELWFTTKSKLLPADKDTAADVYERSADGSIHLVSGGTANVPATIIGGLEDGSSVLFTTQERLLVPADGDTLGSDIYEWRPDGKLRLVSFGPTAPIYLGENADGSVVFTTPDNNPAAGDNDGIDRPVPAPARRSAWCC